MESQVLVVTNGKSPKNNLLDHFILHSKTVYPKDISGKRRTSTVLYSLDSVPRTVKLPPSSRCEPLKPSEAGWVEKMLKLPSAVLSFHF